MARPDPAAAAARLLADLDPLPHPERMRRLARAGRERRGEVRVLLEALEGAGAPAPEPGRRWGLARRGRDSAVPFVPGRAYERGIAVLLAAMAGDTAWIAARLADPDAFVRGHALRAADAVAVPDAAFEAALTDAPRAVRRRILRVLAAGRRTALADRLVDGVRRDWGDAEAARLLPGCSEDVVVRLLPEVLHAVRGPSVLAKRHHGVLLDVVTRELTAAPEALRDACWERCAAALEAGAEHDPGRVLDLLERYAPTRFPRQLLSHLAAFAAAAPDRTLRLLAGEWGAALRGSGRLTRSVLRRLARHDGPELTAYARSVADDSDALARLLAAHPPAARPALYAAAVEGRGAGPATVDGVLWGVLPRHAAADEARRVAARARADGAYWTAVLAAESYLPCAEVRERLVTATRRPVADDRAEAWPFLVRNAARSRDAAEVTLVVRDMAERLANEQDPVRSEALYALSTVRPALLTPDAVPHLDRLAADAVAARDCSYDTRDALSTLALAVLREHAADARTELVGWGLRTLTRLTGGTGRADFGRLDRVLRRGQEHAVYEALRPWIEAGAEKADYGLVFALARAVGRRARSMAGLQDLLWRAIRFGDNPTAATAIGLWLEGARTSADRDERVARVLAGEPSAAALAPVHTVLTHRRTDLLDPLLGTAPPYGRFLAEGSAWTLPADSWAVRRWTARQQEAWARRLGAAVADGKLPLADRAAALGRCAAAPGVGADLVRHWSASADVRLAEAGLAALAHTDRPGDAVPALLAHAGDDRARVAVYAANRASQYVAPSLLAGPLREVLVGPGAKVTSRKEAARLAAARLPAATAAALLREAYRAPGGHPDVRAACVACCGGLLGEAPVRELLADAVRDELAPRYAVLRMRPLDVAPAHRERYARLVCDVGADGDAETAVLAFGALPRWAPWSAAAAEVLGAACADLARGRAVWQAAADGLVAAAVTAVGGDEALCAALDALAAVPGEPGMAARRRVEHVVARLASARGVTGRSVARRAGELLTAYEDFRPQAVRLLVAAVDVAGGAVGPDLERVAVLHEGRPVLAGETARGLAERLAGADASLAGAALLPVARALAAGPGPARPLFAVSLARTLGSRTGWPPPWRTLLTTLRHHPLPDTRAAALAVPLP
ncbi:hypothetical protein [Streptomyces spectabilis]|uniref:HEAT repeat domain-containing protein n=1 Tax=Streptomyces spectabilis TaxID=68270 RepID=A0A516RG96_STRST|nr:hypothetical protein [Streptomyces spectabilis]QDQ14696.1 hypothetical protein FH965_32515 [Streptomyces spectabilis]